MKIFGLRRQAGAYACNAVLTANFWKGARKMATSFVVARYHGWSWREEGPPWHG